MHRFRECISFLNIVKKEQPLILTHCLTEDDLDTLTGRQTGAMLQSQTVMYEVLKLNEADEGADSEPDQFY